MVDMSTSLHPSDKRSQAMTITAELLNFKNLNQFILFLFISFLLASGHKMTCLTRLLHYIDFANLNTFSYKREVIVDHSSSGS